MRTLKWAFVTSALMQCFPLSSRAETIEEFLRAFHANPAKEMERLPSVVVNGEAISRGYIDHQKTGLALPARLEMRDLIMSHEKPELRGLELDPNMEGKDRPERIMDASNPIRNLRDLDSQKLTISALDPAPWADSYWPTYKGIIGIRYADKNFPDSTDWVKNNSYILSNPAPTIFAYGDPKAIDTLSPAEKYDYVVGDTEFTLTRNAWGRGARVYEKSGVVPTWVGFCHGWAAAAHMAVPIPDKAITVKAASGVPITFYPQDIKGLHAFLWANASPSTRFMGNRCNVEKPDRDSFGRIIDPLCWDTNPGSWHIAITNQMGSGHRSLVMDSTFDYQVWNFPLADYKYRYFNPQNWKETTSLNAAAVPLSQFKLDKFKKYRSPKAKYVVGIYMDVSHVNAISPTRGTLKKTPLKTLRFIYDLELDENFGIVGGEWYSNAHPDFVWTFAKDAQPSAISDGEAQKDNWNPNAPVPPTWAEYAKRASNRGEPLASFLRVLNQGATQPGEDSSAPTNPDEVGPNEN